MPSELRAKRIADRIHEELSTLLLMETADPRLSNVNISKVRVDREISFANVYVSSLMGSSEAEEILAGLQHAGGYLRSELARRVELRHFPRLRFYWDHSPEHADRIEQLLASLDISDEPVSDTEESSLNDDIE
ncbi:MAG: 30S ribosome-binding factor RbfA [Chloroflexi bacterium]|jgi:ribosome-binding factor A|nr:30S ribosome-binding factor RbfA [Chloroflexota bacterium]